MNFIRAEKILLKLGGENELHLKNFQIVQQQLAIMSNSLDLSFSGSVTLLTVPFSEGHLSTVHFIGKEDCYIDDTYQSILRNSNFFQIKIYFCACYKDVLRLNILLCYRN